MGRGIVLAEIGAGQYTVREEIDTTTIIARVLELNATQASAQAELALLQAERVTVQAALDNALDAIDVAIVAGETGVELQSRVNAAAGIRAQLTEIDRQIGSRSLEITSATTQIAELNTYLSANRDRNAWTADLIEGIPVSTSVGLIEPGRQTRDPLIIQPSRNATDYLYDGARDGIISPAVVAPPNTFFINHIKSPAAIRWRARYRIGTIQTINTGNDTCSVQMDTFDYNVLDAGIDGLLPRNTLTLTAVPIDYLTCNAEAFTVGSRVVVEFDAQGDDPMVVGFEDNPQPCSQSCGQAFIRSVNFQAFLQTCIISLNDGVYNWSPGTVNIRVLIFAIPQTANVDLATYVGPLTVEGLAGGQALNFDIRAECKPIGTQTTWWRPVSVDNGLMYAVIPQNTFTGSPIISVAHNFSSLPLATTGNAPAFIDPQSPTNYGYTNDEAITCTIP